MKTQAKMLAVLLLMSATYAPLSGFAQSDDLLSGAEAALSGESTQLRGETLDVEADYEAPEEASSEEIIEAARQKSEKKNVKKISKKISNLKVSKKQVKAITTKEQESLSNRISGIFGLGTDKQEDKVETNQAAVQKVEMKKEEIQLPFEENIRIIPNGGITTIEGNGISIESKMSGGVDVETMVSPRVALGVGLGYTTAEMTDIREVWRNYIIDSEELNYKQLEVRANSKFFLTTKSLLRPYLGLGVAYNRVTLEYVAKGQKDTNLGWYGRTNQYETIKEEYSSGYVSANVSAGAEIKITKNVGITLEGRYSKGVITNIGGDSIAQTEDQVRLDNVGNSITESDFFSLNGGILVTF